MGGIRKNSFSPFQFLSFLFIFVLLVSSGPWGCANSPLLPSGDNTPVAAPIQAQQNPSSPTQPSGTPSPRYDPYPLALYRVWVSDPGDKFEMSGEKLWMKGSVNKTRDSSPSLQDRVLRVIDQRSQKYIDTPLTFDAVNNTASFEVKFLIPPMKLSEAVYSDPRPLVFFISPTQGAASPADLNVEKSCGNDANCFSTGWHIAGLYGPDTLLNLMPPRGRHRSSENSTNTQDMGNEGENPPQPTP